MSSLIDAEQEAEIRQAFTDIADTWPFPIKIIRTTYTNAAFATDPTVEEFPLTAIREYGSASESDRYRNALGPAGTHEHDLYVGWQSVEDAGLVDVNQKVLLDHNDVVQMEGEIYEIVAFAGVAQMLTKPTFLQIRVRRRFEDPDGAEAV